MYCYVFDIGGVLVGYNADDLAALLAGTGNYDLGSVRSLLDHEPLYQIETGKMTGREFYKKYVCTIMPGLPYEAWVNVYTEYFELNRPGFELMTDMKARGRRVYTLSNLADIHKTAIERKIPGFFENFDNNYLSFEMRCHKPEREIYQKLIYGVGEKPENIVFFDDSLQNVESAKAAGINGILFTNERIDEIRGLIEHLEST
jgi:FMN phosphatase YigB (HAD superfamily)